MAVPQTLVLTAWQEVRASKHLEIFAPLAGLVSSKPLAPIPDGWIKRDVIRSWAGKLSGALQGRDWYHLSHLLREIQSPLDFILDSTSNVTLRALDCALFRFIANAVFSRMRHRWQAIIKAVT
ncbi:hypothetical protein ARMGADRAFT_1031822 [Armillaria gallica]|uniref:Uncharacterized protein n=1 Tax=Armillaria gallica TaxID=47427 RepID=A0A2H3DD55_ARMGA|nr:hypothetical protein ARMGADRAFT_1031822 [Armillaria gallica]